MGISDGDFRGSDDQVTRDLYIKKGIINRRG